MRVIVAGSRRLNTDHELVWLVGDAVCKSGFKVTEIVSGGARGIDLAGELYANAKLPPIPIKRFPAQWDLHGKSAGPIRNFEMACYADALVLIWDGSSRGSAHMKSVATTKGLKIYEYIVK